MALLVTLAVVLLATARLVSPAPFAPSDCSKAPYTSVTACAGEVLAAYYCSSHLFFPAPTSRVIIPGSSTRTTTKTKTVTASTILTTVKTVQLASTKFETVFETAPANADAITEPRGCDFVRYRWIGFTRQFTDTNGNSYSQRQTLSTGCYCATGTSVVATITRTSNPVVTKSTTITKSYSTVFTSTVTSSVSRTFTETLTRLSNVLKQTTPCPQPTTMTTEVFETTYTYALYQGVFATYGPTAGAATTDLVFDIFQGTPLFEYCMSLCGSGGLVDGKCTNFLWHPRGIPGCVIQYDDDRGSDYVCYENPKFNSSIIIGSQ